MESTNNLVTVAVFPLQDLIVFGRSYVLESRRPATGVESCPGSESPKRVSRGVSEGSGPQKESKKRVSGRLCESKITCFFDSGDSLLNFFGGGRPVPSETPVETLLLVFRAGAVFDSCSWSCVTISSPMVGLFPKEQC